MTIRHMTRYVGIAVGLCIAASAIPLLANKQCYAPDARSQERAFSRAVTTEGGKTIWLGGQIFNHPAAQAHPWLWSFVHGVAVLFACVGVVIFWRITEDWLELTVRYLAPDHGGRAIKDKMNREVIAGLEEAGIAIGATRQEAVEPASASAGV